MGKCLICLSEISSEASYHDQCSKHLFGSKNQLVINLRLVDIPKLAKQIVEQKITVPGFQPKISLSLFSTTGDKKEQRLTIMDALGGNYILKPPSIDFPEMPENEQLTMLMAQIFGIRVAPFGLIRLFSGELAYITKRLDRTLVNSKIHMLDFAQITDSYEKYKSSMERIGKALESYSANPLLDKLKLFELTVFCFLTGNNDMHLKNFSMIQESIGWVLSPAYDLLNVSIILPSDKEELALTLKGKKSKLTYSDFFDYGRYLKLNKKQIDTVFARMKKNKTTALELIQHSFLSDEKKAAYTELVQKRYTQLKLV